MITQELALKFFEYKDGVLYWKSMPYKRNDLIGTEAGTLDGDRRQITINKKHYKTHRLVYLMFHGFMPKEIDHIDGDSQNNKFENLKLLCPNCHSLTKTWKNTGSRKSTRIRRKK